MHVYSLTHIYYRITFNHNQCCFTFNSIKQLVIIKVRSIERFLAQSSQSNWRTYFETNWLDSTVSFFEQVLAGFQTDWEIANSIFYFSACMLKANGSSGMQSTTIKGSSFRQNACSNESVHWVLSEIKRGLNQKAT